MESRIDIQASDGASKRSGIKSLFALMMPYIRRHTGGLTLVFILVIVSNLMLLVIPTCTGRIVDALGFGAGGVDFHAVFLYAGLILLLSITGWLLECGRNALMVRISQSIVYALRQSVFGHLMKLPLSFLESSTKGDIISRISMDIDQLSDTITSDAMTALTSVVTVIGALGMMLAISPKLSLIFVLIIPAIVLSARLISQQSRKRFRTKKIGYAVLSTHAEEMITAQKTVKLFGLERWSEKRYNQLSDDYEKAAQSAEFCSSIMMPLMNAINNISFLLISLLGCFLFLAGEITIGSISSFIVYSKKFSSPIVETANLYNTFQAAFASCDRIRYLLKEPAEQDRPGLSAPEKPLRGNVEFSNVTFSYAVGSPVLRNVSFRARPGQRVAIVGETGSGKTTLMNLLLRFYSPDSGTIRIDGIDVRNIPLDALRRSFALVLQENFVFEMSVRDNVDYAAQSGDLEAVRTALREAMMDEFIDELPAGYDTMLYPDSQIMSQGQKQLLTIARAAMIHPSLFIFDEATSSVDTLTEQKIKAVMDRMMEGKTAFIIAHRLSTILGADMILVMSHGQLVESGTHEALLRRGGLYRTMYESQFIAAGASVDA